MFGIVCIDVVPVINQLVSTQLVSSAPTALIVLHQDNPMTQQLIQSPGSAPDVLRKGQMHSDSIKEEVNRIREKYENVPVNNINDNHFYERWESSDRLTQDVQHAVVCFVRVNCFQSQTHDILLSERILTIAQRIHQLRHLNPTMSRAVFFVLAHLMFCLQESQHQALEFFKSRLQTSTLIGLTGRTVKYETYMKNRLIPRLKLLDRLRDLQITITNPPLGCIVLEGKYSITELILDRGLPDNVIAAISTNFMAFATFCMDSKTKDQPVLFLFFVFGSCSFLHLFLLVGFQRLHSERNHAK